MRLENHWLCVGFTKLENLWICVCFMSLENNWLCVFIRLENHWLYDSWDWRISESVCASWVWRITDSVCSCGWRITDSMINETGGSLTLCGLHEAGESLNLCVLHESRESLTLCIHETGELLTLWFMRLENHWLHGVGESLTLCGLHETGESLALRVLHEQYRIQRLGRGGPRNMKSMWPPLTAIFFMTYLYRAGGAMAPSAPPQIRYWWGCRITDSEFPGTVSYTSQWNLF